VFKLISSERTFLSSKIANAIRGLNFSGDGLNPREGLDRLFVHEVQVINECDT
jgi:hypothetical protein